MLKIWLPAIPYKPLPKNGKKGKKIGISEKRDDESESDKDNSTKYCTLEVVKFDPDDPDSDGYMQKVAVFEDGHPEEWVKWRKEITKLFKVLGYNNHPAQQHKLYCSLLASKAAEYYNEFFNCHAANNVALPKDVQLHNGVVLEHTLNDVAKKVFPNWEIALRAQKAYIQKCLVMGNENLEIFKDQLLEMNKVLIYFPTHMDPGSPGVPLPHALDEDELVNIMDGSKRFEW